MFKYILDIFRAGSAASFARWSTLGTILVGCWSVVHVVLKTNALPDGTALIGMGTFMVSPYAISKAAAAFSKPDEPPQ